MAKRNNDLSKTVLAMANSNTSGALVGTAINATGFGRARFVFTFGPNAGGASINSNSIGVYQGGTSGAITSAIASASFAAVTSGSLSNIVMEIDTVVNSAYPWLQVSGALVNSSMYSSAIAELYQGTRLNPPTATELQVVTV